MQKRSFILFRGKHLTLAAIVAVAIAEVSGAAAVGYREAVGIAVEAGAETALTERVALSADGRFMKSGDGRLTMPTAAIDPSVSPTMHVLGGTLSLTADAAASVDIANPPDVISEKATFWVDATDGNGLVTDGESQYAMRWCDRRETNPSSPTMWYADSWWTNSTSSALWGVPPAVKTVDGRRTVFFGGKSSSQCMMFCKGGKWQPIAGVRDVFLVFGVTNCLGLVLGYYGDPESTFFNTEVSEWTDKSAIKRFHHPRNNVGMDSFVARFYLDGTRFDPFTEGPKRGFQLYERHHVDDVRESRAQAFFTGYNDKNPHEGGDYLCEAIVFTNRLTETQRLDVRQYLMAKWDLPHRYRTATPMQRGYATFAASSNAIVEVDVADSESMDDIRLAGDGTLVKKGAGTLTLGPSGDVPFSGTLRLDGGAVATRGGRIPSVRLSAGQRINSREVNTSSAAPDTAEGQAAAATTVTLHGDAKEGMAVKDGPGPAHVRSVASDVKLLKVAEGQLVLDVGSVASPYAPASATSVDIPNHNFEIPLSAPYRNSDSYSQFRQLDQESGWTALNVNSEKAVVLTSVPSAEYGDQWRKWCTHPCPEGTNVLYLISSAGAYTTITFPADGYYEGSVLASVRHRGSNPGNEAYYSPVDVFLGEDLDSTNVIGTIIGATKDVKNGEDFRRYHFRTGKVEAGKEYVFGVKSRTKIDCGMALDDFRLDLIPDGERQQAAYKIPNGDFEQIGPIQNMYVPTNGCTTEGWTFCDWLVQSVPLVAVVMPSTITSAARLFTSADVVWNSAQIALMSNSWIETTFTPPAGTYWLRGRMADWPMRLENIVTFGTVGATVNAKVTIGGAAQDLGELVASSHRLTGYLWPNAFTVDGATPVTLRIEQQKVNSAAIVDDFELVSAMTDELLADPSADDTTKWKGLDPAAPKLVPNGAQAGYLRTYDGTVSGSDVPYTTYWGHNRFAGDRYMFIAQNGGVQSAVSIPSPGTYRLTYHERSRLTPHNGGNPVRAWIRSEDGAYTNFISKSTRYFCTNFVEHAFMFTLPSAGKYVLAFQGTGYDYMNNPREDIEALVDGVSLKYVTETPADVPDVPEKLRIKVSEGAMLALDFPGTIRTGKVTLGGERIIGYVDSTTHPDYICGMGSIEARPEGTVVVIR